MVQTAKFITLEGSEGAGKTTAINEVCRVLDSWQVPYLTTREPGGEENAEKIRDLLLYSNHLDEKTELLLMFAARNEHLVKVIRPALIAGTWVVSDRFVDASFAYQGMGRGIDWQTIQFFEEFVVNATAPDLTLYLDVDPEVGLARAANRSAKDRIEKEDVSFFNSIRSGYERRLNEHPERIKKIDANQNVTHVIEEINEVLNGFKKSLFV